MVLQVAFIQEAETAKVQVVVDEKKKKRMEVANRKQLEREKEERKKELDEEKARKQHMAIVFHQNLLKRRGLALFKRIAHRNDQIGSFIIQRRNDSVLRRYFDAWRCTAQVLNIPFSWTLMIRGTVSTTTRQPIDWQFPRKTTKV